MKAVIKQDFLRRRSGVLISSLVLFLLNISVIIAIVIAGRSTGSTEISQVYSTQDGITVTTTSGLKTFVDIAIPIILMVDTIGVFIWALDQGAYNIGKDLKGDVGYLYKMVPRSGWNLLGGKLIVGTAEFLIYAIQSYIYILLIQNVLNADSVTDSMQFNWNINGVILNTHTNLFTTSLFLLFVAVVQFVLGATLLSFASITGTAFLKNRRFTKPIVAVGIFALAIFVGRVTARILMLLENGLPMNVTQVLNLVWVGLFIELVFGAAFYVLTCILWEKKVSV